MAPSEVQRDATATIRGYRYQFDASILAVLGSEPEEKIIVEGIEDFDIVSSGTDTYGQVKYYESQKLTNATIRDAVVPMIRGFIRFSPYNRARKRYRLYGHFKEAPDTPPVLSLAALKGILVRRTLIVDDKTGGSVRTDVDIQKELEASDEDLSDFCSKFKIELGEPIAAHRARVIETLKSELRVSSIESTEYSYPTAFSAMATLASGRSEAERTTTKSDFLKIVRPNLAIYSAWALREEGERAYCSMIRERYFMDLNIESRDRFFVINLPDSQNVCDIYSLVEHIIGRWSSHKLNFKPAKERYAPLFFFPGMSVNVLTDLKQRLVENRHKITDGYAFNGAKFSVEQLMLPQTREWPISGRFMSTLAEFHAALTKSAKSRLIIQLHAGDPLAIMESAEHIIVLVESAVMARKIL